MAGDVVRAFVALELPEEMRDRLVSTVAALRPRLPGVRWVGEHAFHLTLRFLGWSRPEQLAQVEAVLGQAAAACPPFESRVAGLGLFPERGSPRVLWIGMEPPPSVVTLQEACEAAAVKAGFEAESRRFRPHLTLGRWKDRARRPDLEAVDLGSCRIERLVLFRSQLRPTGSIYTPLHEFPLGPRPTQGMQR